MRTNNRIPWIVTVAVLGLLPLVLGSMSSANYGATVTTVRSGGGTTNSTNYNTSLIIGDVAGNTSSNNYITYLGFFFGGLEYSDCGMVIDSSGTHTLTNDILDCENDYIITIDSDDVTLDCDDHVINGTGSYGIHAESGRDNVIIRDCVVNLTGPSSDFGILLMSTNSYVYNNTVQVTDDDTIRVTGDNATVYDNYFTAGSDYGAELYNVDNADFYENTLTASNYAVGLTMTAASNVISNNTLTATTSHVVYDNTTGSNTLIYTNQYATANWTQANLNVSQTGTLGLTNNLDLQNNSIYVNSTKFGSFTSIPANLTFTSPGDHGDPAEALVNGTACPANQCATPTKMGSDYWYNVTGFSNYSVGESAPTVTYQPPTPAANDRTINNNQTVNVTVTTSGLNVDTCTIEWQGSNRTMTKIGTGSSVTCHYTNDTLIDGTDYTFKVYANSSGGTVGAEAERTFRENDKPTTPVLDYPNDDDQFFTNRTPRYNWTTSADADGDDVNYTFQLSLTDDFSTTLTNQSSITNNYYQQASELGFDAYYWRVLAYDAYENSSWSSTFNFTLVPSVTITLINDTVDFSTELDPGDTDDTTDSIPPPFRVRNDGNTYADLVNASANQSLWQQAALGTAYWRFKADNASGEADAFDWATSITDWTNISGSNQSLIKDLNYTDANDEAVIDIFVEVPQSEPPGSKKGYLTFSWEESPTRP
ncbi:right-handed parallel beta-helix repeat-containing protein [Candidatus Woesearchaeota archaeon]|nr:right-handed parallel beta-helix repeat-containing protein [Candidatus Woesearchaeota archaeon]